jgi:hypothetical protein
MPTTQNDQTISPQQESDSVQKTQTQTLSADRQTNTVPVGETDSERRASDHAATGQNDLSVSNARNDDGYDSKQAHVVTTHKTHGQILAEKLPSHGQHNDGQTDSIVTDHMIDGTAVGQSGADKQSSNSKIVEKNSTDNSSSNNSSRPASLMRLHLLTPPQTPSERSEVRAADINDEGMQELRATSRSLRQMFARTDNQEVPADDRAAGPPQTQTQTHTHSSIHEDTSHRGGDSQGNTRAGMHEGHRGIHIPVLDIDSSVLDTDSPRSNSGARDSPRFKNDSPRSNNAARDHFPLPSAPLLPQVPCGSNQEEQSTFCLTSAPTASQNAHDHKSAGNYEGTGSSSSRVLENINAHIHAASADEQHRAYGMGPNRDVGGMYREDDQHRASVAGMDSKYGTVLGSRDAGLHPLTGSDMSSRTLTGSDVGLRLLTGGSLGDAKQQPKDDSNLTMKRVPSSNGSSSACSTPRSESESVAKERQRVAVPVSFVFVICTYIYIYIYIYIYKCV